MTSDRADELVHLLASIMDELDAGEASVDRLEQILTEIEAIKSELPLRQ